MSAVTSSSLSFNSGITKSSGLLKRPSKQEMSAHKMFGNKFGKHGKDLQIGKKFRKKGKGIMQGATSATMMFGGISPSIDEFDDMLSKASGSSSSNNNNKKKMFSRKQFG